MYVGTRYVVIAECGATEPPARNPYCAWAVGNDAPGRTGSWSHRRQVSDLPSA